MLELNRHEKSIIIIFVLTQGRSKAWMTPKIEKVYRVEPLLANPYHLRMIKSPLWITRVLRASLTKTITRHFGIP